MVPEISPRFRPSWSGGSHWAERHCFVLSTEWTAENHIGWALEFQGRILWEGGGKSIQLGRDNKGKTRLAYYWESIVLHVSCGISLRKPTGEKPASGLRIFRVLMRPRLWMDPRDLGGGRPGIIFSRPLIWCEPCVATSFTGGCPLLPPRVVCPLGSSLLNLQCFIYSESKMNLAFQKVEMEVSKPFSHLKPTAKFSTRIEMYEDYFYFIKS